MTTLKEVLLAHEERGWTDVNKFECMCGASATIPPLGRSVNQDAAVDWHTAHLEPLLRELFTTENEDWCDSCPDREFCATAAGVSCAEVKAIHAGDLANGVLPTHPSEADS